MQIYLVGGAVRDRLLNMPVTDRDYVVVGATPQMMQEQGFYPVGRDFPVFIHPETGEEYALARTERKTARGHQGFTFDCAPEVTLTEDLQRRDLTINAIAAMADGTLIDPYGGVADIQGRILRHVSAAFEEDPLRVLRLARFYARFAPQGFSIAPETMALCRRMVVSGELQDLTGERVWAECVKALGYTSAWCFFDVLQTLDALFVLFGESLSALAWSEMRQALMFACHQTHDVYIRLGAWLALDKKGAAAIQQHLPLPKVAQHWINLLARHRETALNWQQATIQARWQLLKAAGSLRQSGDLPALLSVLPLTAHQRQTILHQAAQVQAIDIRALQQAGYSGAALGKAIQEAQFAVLDRYS